MISWYSACSKLSRGGGQGCGKDGLTGADDRIQRVVGEANDQDPEPHDAALVDWVVKLVKDTRACVEEATPQQEARRRRSDKRHQPHVTETQVGNPPLPNAVRAFANLLVERVESAQNLCALVSAVDSEVLLQNLVVQQAIKKVITLDARFLDGVSSYRHACVLVHEL